LLFTQKVKRAHSHGRWWLVLPALFSVVFGSSVFGRTAHAAQSNGIQVSVLTTFAPGTHAAAAAASNNGDVVALVGTDLIKVGPDGQQKAFGSVPPGTVFGVPIGVAYNHSHELFVADPLITGGMIFQMSPTGNPTAVPGSQGMTSPDGFGFDSAGNMYVTDILAGSIWKVAPGGTAQLWTSGLALPDGVKVFNNKVYTSLEAGKIETIDINPDGSAGAKSTWAQLAAYPHAFFDDMVLDDRTGDVYVSRLDTNQLLQITPQGQVTPIASCQNNGLEGAANMALIHVGNNAVIYLADAGEAFAASCPNATASDIVKITIPDK
jgi:hypothetical protein